MKSAIHVCVRVKPAENNREYWRIGDDNKSISCDKMPDAKCFDYVFSPSSESADIYNKLAKQIILNSFNGINGTILAYGQTGSGKTFTMTGNSEHPGIIVHAVNDIFALIKEKSSKYNISVYFSFYEIYCEKYRDLLVDDSESNSRQSFITIKATNAAEILKLLQEGNERRSIGATKMNNQSSRSHSLAKICLNIQPIAPGEHTLTSELFLVDLAGSECISDTEATGNRKIEAKNINISLLSLSTVVDALVHNRAVSYASSKLTKDLKNSIGGNSKTAIICTISGDAQQRYVSENTLRFASNAMKVKNTPKSNKIVSDKVLIDQLKNEIISLQAKLSKYENEIPGKHIQEIQESRNRIEEITTTIFDESRKSYSRLAAPRKSYTANINLDLLDSQSDDDNSVTSEIEADRLCQELSNKVLKESKTEIINMDKIEIESLKEKNEKLAKEMEEKVNSLNVDIDNAMKELQEIRTQYSLLNESSLLREKENNEKIKILEENIQMLTLKNAELQKLNAEYTKEKEEIMKMKTESQEEKQQADWEVSYYIKALTDLQMENDNLQKQLIKPAYAEKEIQATRLKRDLKKENNPLIQNINENKLANKLLDILETESETKIEEYNEYDHVDNIIIPEINKEYYSRKNYYIPRENYYVKMFFHTLTLILTFVLCVCVIVL
ncbi:Kinesin motor domain containing protein [Trichomonas vaginalis G3]|uniref:Kinesin-like protein n=1 Tax=Trichomonas vaginalis (strain ATCC PRA-98 / G3) TaxID=412133 RepID=A2FQ17_TRIV3|nr:microtubule motor protein [Trichomonas vaginalis G3]EAX93005.1 Kinesin motor domain containing protein [Trichomonas vaginalis G3]KAI5549952.1 microtubule motor protein [Trichomonas vaginalis G3]|eukprot:XP_001305935.1 Kinesin motor domain containing protein [Trichomonas vaginalis G3]